MDTFSIVLMILVLLPFLLFFIRIFLLSWQNVVLTRQLKQLAEEEAQQQQQQQQRQQRARLQAENAAAAANAAETEFGTTNEPPKDDLPPDYAEIMQTFENEKQRMAAEEMMGGNLTNAASTVTIDTQLSVSNNNLSHIELSRPMADAGATTAITTVTVYNTQQ